METCVRAALICAGMSSGPSVVCTTHCMDGSEDGGTSRRKKALRSVRTSGSAFSWISSEQEVWRTKTVSSPSSAPAERTKAPAWGLEGGESAGVANIGGLRQPDGSRTSFGKATRMKVPKGATFELTCGGGGGYGPPAERDPEAVHADVREGYVTEARAREQYPHAFED